MTYEPKEDDLWVLAENLIFLAIAFRVLQWLVVGA